MPDFSTLVLFAAACLALTATPGPDMLLIVSRSVSQGRASGFATLAGIQVGTYCHALAAPRPFAVVPGCPARLRRRALRGRRLSALSRVAGVPLRRDGARA